MKRLLSSLFALSLVSMAAAEENLMAAFQQNKDPLTVCRKIVMADAKPWSPPRTVNEIIELNKIGALEPALTAYMIREVIVDLKQGFLPDAVTFQRSLDGTKLVEEDFVQLALGGVHPKVLPRLQYLFPVKFSAESLGRLSKNGVDPRISNYFSSCAGPVPPTPRQSIIPSVPGMPPQALESMKREMAENFGSRKFKEDLFKQFELNFNSRLVAQGSQSAQRLFVSEVESDQGTKPGSNTNRQTSDLSNNLADAAAPAAFLTKIPGLGHALNAASILVAFSGSGEYNVSVKDPLDVDKIKLQQGLQFVTFRNPGAAVLVPMTKINGKPSARFRQGGLLFGLNISPVTEPLPTSTTQGSGTWIITPSKDLQPGFYALIWGKKEDFQLVPFEIVAL